MSCIVCPIDFSASSDHAIGFAYDLAKRMQMPLVLLHVYDSPLMAASHIFTGSEATGFPTTEWVEEKIINHLNGLIEENKHWGVQAEGLTIGGNVVDQIANYCKENEIAFVVMGTLGQTGLAEVLIGSVTDKVIREVECPVFAIPSEAILQPYDEMVYATSLQYDETRYFEALLALAQLYDASVTFLHVNDDANVEKQHSKSLDAVLEKSDYGRVARVTILAKDVTAAINEYVTAHKKDLLVMTTHTHSFLDRLFHKSVTRSEVLHTKIPLLVFSHKVHSITLL